MSNEATVRSSLRIRSGKKDYRSYPESFRADVSELTGPTPGEILVTTIGRDVDLTELETPGLCRIQNLDDTEYVLVGIDDGASFFPLMEILPGESYVIRLYRQLGYEFTGTGTGTPSDVNMLHIKTVHGEARVLVEAFGK